MKFKEDYKFPSTVSVSTMASFSAKLTYGSKKSNPNIQVFGSDENYITASGYEIDRGRNFSVPEVLSGTPWYYLDKKLKIRFLVKQKSNW